jgi:hypothetical protein
LQNPWCVLEKEMAVDEQIRKRVGRTETTSADPLRRLAELRRFMLNLGCADKREPPVVTPRRSVGRVRHGQ